MSGLPEIALHALCPMHAVLTESGHIRQAGPTLHKLTDQRLEGAAFLDVFEVYRPRAISSMKGLLQNQGRKLHLRLRDGVRTQLKGAAQTWAGHSIVHN